MINKGATTLRFVSLRERPELLETVARWHQQEWRQEDLQQRQETLRGHLCESDLPETLLVVVGETAVGSVSLVNYRRLGGYPESAWMANLYVLPDARRQGVGAALVQEVVRRAQALRLPQLYLYTHDQEQYYAGLGWVMLKRHYFKTRPVTIMCHSLR